MLICRVLSAVRRRFFDIYVLCWFAGPNAIVLLILCFVFFWFFTVDILKDKWSALYDVRTILLSIQSLLGEPNNESPLNAQASLLWPNQTDYKKYLDEFYEKNKEEAWNQTP